MSLNETATKYPADQTNSWSQLPVAPHNSMDSTKGSLKSKWMLSKLTLLTKYPKWAQLDPLSRGRSVWLVWWACPATSQSPLSLIRQLWCVRWSPWPRRIKSKLEICRWLTLCALMTSYVTSRLVWVVHRLRFTRMICKSGRINSLRVLKIVKTSKRSSWQIENLPVSPATTTSRQVVSIGIKN